MMMEHSLLLTVNFYVQLITLNGEILGEDIHPKSQSGRFKYTMKYRILLLRVVDFAQHVCCTPLLRDVKTPYFNTFKILMT